MVYRIKIGILDVHSGYDESSWYVDTFTYGKIRENICDCYTELDIYSFQDLATAIYENLKPEDLHPKNFIKKQINEALIDEPKKLNSKAKLDPEML